jgi:hypothetical protein
MLRNRKAVVDASEWVNATMEWPCRICGATDGCSSLADDTFARCLEQPSEWPLVVGGWLHRLELVAGPGPVIGRDASGRPRAAGPTGGELCVQPQLIQKEPGQQEAPADRPSRLLPDGSCQPRIAEQLDDSRGAGFRRLG